MISLSYQPAMYIGITIVTLKFEYSVLNINLLF